MPLIAIIDTQINHSGAKITSSPQSTVYVNGKLVAIVGAVVENHTYSSVAHNGDTVASGSTKVFIGGIGVARVGDPITAVCNDTLTSTGASTNVYAG